MPDNQRDIAETVFERNQRREMEINDALKQEQARREAAVKNMYRLRALRLARDTKLNNPLTSSHTVTPAAPRAFAFHARLHRGRFR
jgi:hypothetical protein